MQSARLFSRWSLHKRLAWIRSKRKARGGQMSKEKLTPTDLDARLKFVVGCTLAGVLTITTVGVLYALVFVTQPIGAQAENDKMFFGVLSSVATFITGTLAGLMISTGRTDKEKTAQSESSEIADGQ